MGLPDTPSEAPHLYPQAIQLKLYQAFIFSIPILFSIILFLLFYLFYLKRRASVLSSTPILPTSSNQATTYVHSVRPLTLSFSCTNIVTKQKQNKSHSIFYLLLHILSWIVQFSSKLFFSSCTEFSNSRFYIFGRLVSILVGKGKSKTGFQQSCLMKN